MKQVTVLLLLFFIGINTYSQEKHKGYERETFDALEERSKLKYRIVPLPTYDPSTKLGFSVTNLFTFYPNKQDTIVPPSLFGLGAQITTNGSWLAGAGGTLYLAEDNWRINPQFIYGHINQELNLVDGIITNAQRKFTVFNFMIHRHIAHRIYLGAGYSYRGVTYEGRDSASQVHLEDHQMTDADGNHGLKYSLTQDQRENINYPYSGYYASFRSEQYFASGDATAYWANYVDWRQYISLSDIPGQHVLAYRFLGRFLSGEVQPQNYTYYGRTGGDVQRGYETGKRIDKNMINIEAEYRMETSLLNNKLGFTGIAGLGKAFGEYNDFGDAEWLPMVGVGVRYRLLPYERMNIRLDVTAGKDGGVIYFGIREAF